MKKKVVISVILVALIIIIYFSINRFCGWKKINIGNSEYYNDCNINIDLDGDSQKENIDIKSSGKHIIINGKKYVVNKRASNEYAQKTSVVYPVNRYINPGIKNFFLKHDVDVNEDGFALSEMLQFIWRSAIRKGEEIYVYIPSVRMRNLLKQWINENSLENK